LSDSTSEAYYWCVKAINCTGKRVPDDLLSALGEAEANMYLCEKDIRMSENTLFLVSNLLSPHLLQNV